MPRSIRSAPVRALLLLLSAVLTSPLGAQDPGSTEPRRTLSNLPDSARMRLLSPRVYVEDGFFLGLHGDSVRVVEQDVVLRVGVDEIEELSVRGSKWRTVAVQSAAVAAVAGGLAGFFLGTRGCGDTLQGCDGHAAGVAARWGLAFGVLGGGVGALVGSRLKVWTSVFP